MQKSLSFKVVIQLYRIINTFTLATAPIFSSLSSSSALQDLQGKVESYFLTIESLQSSQILTLPPESISTVICDLWPSTTYLVSLQVSNGAHNTTKAIVNITTEDGGMFIIVGFLAINVYAYTWSISVCKSVVSHIRVCICLYQVQVNFIH